MIKRPGRHRKTLAVMAIFRNEAHILAEWCEHYIAQGAEKIYLINHLSSDNYKAAIKEFQQAGIVELVDAFGEHPQIRSYNALRPRIRRTSRWILPCDLDEFVYGRKGMTIKAYLESLPWTASEVIIPWKNFGSSHHDAHPEGLVTQNFVYRQSYPSQPAAAGDAMHEPAENQSQNWCKYIVRSRRIRHLAVHFASVWFGRIIDANGNPIRHYNGTLAVNEQSLAAANLHLNHYPIQSMEYFKRVKMNRPDVNCPIRDTSKTLEYFKLNDHNDVLDAELSLRWTTGASPAPQAAARPVSLASQR